MFAGCRGLIIAMLLTGSAPIALAEVAEGGIPVEHMNEQQLRAQLERARALNAELDAEHNQLQKDLAVLERQVAAKKRLLSGASEPNPPPSASAVASEASVPGASAWWRGPLGDVALVAAALLTVVGLVLYWRRRAAGKTV